MSNKAIAMGLAAVLATALPAAAQLTPLMPPTGQYQPLPTAPPQPQFAPPAAPQFAPQFAPPGAPQYAPQFAPPGAPQFAPVAPQFAPVAPQFAPQFAPVAPQFAPPAAPLAPAVMAAPGWRPISEFEARLIVSPRAFGAGSVRREVNDGSGARYERAATNLDLSRRFFNIVLRESDPFVIVQDNVDLRVTAAEMLNQRDPGRLVFGQGGAGTVGLGVAEYLTFNFGSIACAAFHITFGPPVRDSAGGKIRGIYCDPAASMLPNWDVGQTLNAIGVRGIYQP